MAKTLEEKAADFKRLLDIEDGLEPAKVDDESKEVASEDTNAAGATDAGTEGGKPEGSEDAAALERKTDAEGRKPEGEVDPAAAAKGAAEAAPGWKGEIKFRGEVKHLDLTPEDLKDVIMKGVNAATIIAEHDQKVAKSVDAYWQQWGFLAEDPTTKKLGPNSAGPFNWLEAAFGKEKAKQFAAEYAGVAPAAGAGSPAASDDVKQIDAELARLDPDEPENVPMIRVLKAEKRAILAEENSQRRIDERFKPFEERTQAADRAAQQYQIQTLATGLKAHRDAEVQKVTKTADPDDLLFVQAKAEALQIERGIALDPRNADALKQCITDAVKALGARTRATVVSKEKEAKALAAASRPAPRSPPPPVGGAGGAVTPPNKEERLPRGHPDYDKQQVSRWRRAKEALGLTAK